MGTIRDQGGDGRAVLIGAGRVGTAVSVLLQRGGWTIRAVGSRREDSARRAAGRLGCRTFALHGDVPPADLYVLGATDAGIAELSTSLAGRLPRGSTAMHMSGSLGTDVLKPLSQAGVLVCALHPVQACPDVDSALRRLPGSAWGVTCEHPLVEWAEELVIGAFQGRPVRVPEEVRPLWHASSVMTSNGISALLAFGERLLETIGIAEPEAVLGPLAAGTVANAVEQGGGRATLTGPIVRGETETIARHLDVLRAANPNLLDGYRKVAASIIEAASLAGRLDPDTEKRLRELVA